MRFTVERTAQSNEFFSVLYFAKCTGFVSSMCMNYEDYVLQAGVVEIREQILEESDKSFDQVPRITIRNRGKLTLIYEIVDSFNTRYDLSQVFALNWVCVLPVGKERH